MGHEERGEGGLCAVVAFSMAFVVSARAVAYSSSIGNAFCQKLKLRSSRNFRGLLSGIMWRDLDETDERPFPS